MGFRIRATRAGTPIVHTATDLLRLPKYPPYELYAGQLRVCEPASPRSSNVAVELAITLGMYVRTHELGKVFGADCGYILGRDPDTIVAPDVSFVRNGRLTYGMRWDKFFEGAPDLAVEVASPSDRLINLHRKAELYRSAGTPLVWIIDPRTQRAIVYRNGETIDMTMRNGTLDGESIVPGFRCALDELFS